MPKVGGDGYDEFNSSPFNFCFLFNKINVRSTEIKGKDQLLHHAVECIYDMSVSPICTRVNSQEDNIIREKYPQEINQAMPAQVRQKWFIHMIR